MVARTRRSKSRSSRKNKSRHVYFMRGCSNSRSNSNKRNFFAKGIHGRLSSKKCKCACHLNKHRAPECKCNCHERSKMIRGRMQGGDALNLSLAYTGKNEPLSPSPYAAYSGKGGSHDLAKAYPALSNTGVKHINWPNSSQTIRGGGSTSYANGLVGSPWSGNSETWSGVNGVGGDSNHYKLNTYDNDVSRQNPPLSGGRRRRRQKHKKTLRGGGFIPQNLVNVGRNFMHNIGASNNEINGYAAPPRPMPYQDQLVRNNSTIFNI